MSAAQYQTHRRSRRTWIVFLGIGIMMFALTLFVLTATGFAQRDAGVILALIPASLVVLLSWWLARRS